MRNIIMNGLYILSVVAICFLLCKYAFNVSVDNQWLLGALIVPLITLVRSSLKD
jgi:hypothetical protein